MRKKIGNLAAVSLLCASILACTSPDEKAADYIVSADSYFQENELVKAEIEYKNALQINQNLPEAWFGLARIYERSREWRQAYGALHKIRELSPDHVEGRIMLGQILLASNQLDQALLDAGEILELVPDSARAHALMAAVQYRLKNHVAAQESVDRALAIDPDDQEALLVRARVLIDEGKHEEVMMLVSSALETSPRNISLHLMKVQAYQQKGDEAAIERTYRELVKLFPENKAFKQILARFYLASNKIDEAEKLLERITKANAGEFEDKARLVGFKNQYRSLDEAIALVRGYIDSGDDTYRLRFLLAELFERNNKTAEAIEVYEAIVNEAGAEANGITAMNKIALLELRAGNITKAQELVGEVLGADAANEDALLMQASFQMSDRNFDDAIVSLRTVLRDNPDSIKALGLLGQAYDASGSQELANESYGKAFRLGPGVSVVANKFASSLLRQRNFDWANEVLQQSISQGNRSIDAVKLLTQVKLSLGEWDEAERLARDLEKVEGQEAVSQHMLGIAFQGKDRQRDSVEAFKRAHELAPGSAQPMVSLVRIYARGGKLAEARKFLVAVIKSDPGNITAYLLLGQLSLLEQDPESALVYFHKAVRIDPGFIQGYRSLASVYRGTGNLEQAEDIINRGLEANPEQLTLKMTLASIYELELRFDDAIAIYESLLDGNADVLVAKNNLASLLTDHRGDEASLERARTLSAVFRDSRVPQFRDTYAWALVRSNKNIEEAVAILKKIVKDNDSVGVYKFHLGEAYREMGEIENARSTLGLAMRQLTPESRLAEQAKAALAELN